MTASESMCAESGKAKENGPATFAELSRGQYAQIWDSSLKTWSPVALLLDNPGACCSDRMTVWVQPTAEGRPVKWHRRGDCRARVVPSPGAAGADQSLAELIRASGLPRDMLVADLPDLTWHVTNPLAGRSGIKSLWRLAELTDDEIRDLPGIGERRLAAIKDAVREAATR
ncbi:hypothetical protein ACFYOK_37590 [Microbispora bryophytorum]|uniref:hypothetical protein n=1 Tax=Microbispora bryophytorum TaxID=1460882 RepID=UPI0033D26788